MVAFTHHQRTTTEAVWLDSPRIAAMPQLTIEWEALDKLVVVAAHPDDETLGAAGLLERAARHGVRVEVLVATMGENSHPDSPTHTPQRLAAVRAVELRNALTLLAPTAHYTALGLPDGNVESHAQELENEIGSAVTSNGQRTMIVAPWSADGHTDHNAVGAAAAKVALTTHSILLEYPIWLWHWGSPTSAQIPWPALRKLELTAQERTTKNHAMACHASQVSPLSAAKGDETLLSPEVLSHFDRDFETFIDVAGYFTPSGTTSEPWLAAQFNAIHANGQEPWDPESWYERRKRTLLLSALPRERFQSVLELGCSTGALTTELAHRAVYLVGVDASSEAVATATVRTSKAINTTIMTATLPHQWPEGCFDLFVLSETGYYLSAADLSDAVEHMAASALPNAVLAACHWRHTIAGWPLGGDDVHRLLNGESRLTLLAAYAEEDFLLDVFTIEA
jgi:LmbE family N-acetylglucosaminyl deacetylase